MTMHAVEGIEKQAISIVQRTGNFILRPLQDVVRTNDIARTFRILVFTYLNSSGNGATVSLQQLHFGCEYAYLVSRATKTV